MLMLKNFLRCELEKQRVVLFYWLPVALACGIGCYLSLRQEPAPNLFIAMALLGGVFYLGYHFKHAAWRRFSFCWRCSALVFLWWPERLIMSRHPRLPTDFMGKLKVEL